MNGFLSLHRRQDIGEPGYKVFPVAFLRVFYMLICYTSCKPFKCGYALRSTCIDIGEHMMGNVRALIDTTLSPTSMLISTGSHFSFLHLREPTCSSLLSHFPMSSMLACSSTFLLCNYSSCLDQIRHLIQLFSPAGSKNLCSLCLQHHLYFLL